MSWDLLVKSAPMLDPKLLSLAFVFLLVGVRHKVGLAPFHAWLPDAHAEGPTPISAVLSGSCSTSRFTRSLRFKMCWPEMRPPSMSAPSWSGWARQSCVRAFMLYRRRDIKRLFAYSSIEHMGIAAFAFGNGRPAREFRGLCNDHAFAHKVRNILLGRSLAQVKAPNASPPSAASP